MKVMHVDKDEAKEASIAIVEKLLREETHYFEHGSLSKDEMWKMENKLRYSDFIMEFQEIFGYRLRLDKYGLWFSKPV